MPPSPSELDMAVQAEMARAGLRALYNRPDHIIVLEGSRFTGVITDNADTAADLTTIASFLDKRIRDIYTTNRPKLIMQIEEVELRFVVNGESESALAELLSKTFIHWKAGKDDWHQPVAKFGGMYADEYAVSTTESGVTKVYPTVLAQRFTMPEPWLIDFENDEFDVAPLEAINLGADVRFYLDVWGGIWPAHLGRPPRRTCPVDAAKAIDLRKQRATVRQQNAVLYPRSRQG